MLCTSSASSSRSCLLEYLWPVGTWLRARWFARHLWKSMCYRCHTHRALARQAVRYSECFWDHLLQAARGDIFWESSVARRTPPSSRVPTAAVTHFKYTKVIQKLLQFQCHAIFTLIVQRQSKQVSTTHANTSSFF